MARKYITLFFDTLDLIEMLSDAERGRLLTAMLEYGKTGTTQELSGNEKFVFPAIRLQIDRGFNEYDDRCLKNKENGKKGGRPKKEEEEPEEEENRTVNKKTERFPEKPNGFKKSQDKDKEEDKEEDKDNINNPPNPPRGKGSNKQSKKTSQTENMRAELRAIRDSYTFGAKLDKAVNNWLKYKYERKDSYVPTGLKSFLTQVKNNMEKHGEQKVIDVICESMANGYVGVTWGKLSQYKADSNKPAKKSAFNNFTERDFDYDALVGLSSSKEDLDYDSLVGLSVEQKSNKHED